MEAAELIWTDSIAAGRGADPESIAAAKRFQAAITNSDEASGSAEQGPEPFHAQQGS